MGKDFDFTAEWSCSFKFAFYEKKEIISIDSNKTAFTICPQLWQLVQLVGSFDSCYKPSTVLTAVECRRQHWQLLKAVDEQSQPKPHLTSMYPSIFENYPSKQGSNNSSRQPLQLLHAVAIFDNDMKCPSRQGSNHSSFNKVVSESLTRVDYNRTWARYKSESFKSTNQDSKFRQAFASMVLAPFSSRPQPLISSRQQSYYSCENLERSIFLQLL